MIGTDQEEKIENGDNKEGTTNGTITGGEYNKENPVIPGGFETVDTENADWNSTDGETVDDWNKGLVIQDKLGNQFVWIPVNKEEYKKQLAERNDESITNISDLKDDTLPSRIEKEIEQIEKYGGFYVSRYEARIPESMTEAINTVSAETRNVEGTPVSKKEQISWNYIDYNTAKKNAEKMYQSDNIQSGLVTGTAWDTLIKFLEGIEGKKPVESGLREWTSEKYSPYMIIRGEENGTYPSEYRGKALPTQTSSDVGFRCILYVKENKLPEEITSNITITATPTTPRNTLSTGTQNEIEKGPIQVTINYGTTELQKQYKKETDTNWTTITGETINISVTENTEIYARYYDGKNSYKTTSKTIQNVDNIAPTISNCEITVNGTTIAVTAQATDKASNGAYPGTEGIVKVEYSIDGTNYQEENTFTISTAGNHTIYVKAIDKAGNEIIVERTATINQYSVNFNANGGTVNPTTKIVTPNTPYGELPIPTREGYTFTGWYTSATDGTKIESTTIVNVSELQTLYAHWTANNYTLTIRHYLENVDDTNYTFCETITQNIAYGTEITLANYAKSITNGTYHHATLAENGTATTTTTMGTNTTIYLYYSRNQYTLTLNKGANIATVTGTGTYKVGKSVTIDATLKTETGYTISWSNWTSNNADLLENNETRNATITMPAGNVTLTANATKTAVNYTLTVKHYLENANDTGYTYQTGKDATSSVAYGTTITLADKKTTITNGTYKQGSLAENGTATTSVTITGNTTIYLYYSRNTYTLTLNKGANIETVTGEGTYKVGKSVTIDATLKTETGYTISWSNWTSNNTSLIPNNSTRNTTITMPAGDVTLTANATKTAVNYTLTVKHYLENANDTGYTYQTGKDATSSVAYGTTITLADKKTTITNGTYKQGSLAENGTSATSTRITANTTIYLYYSRNQYTLTLNKGSNIATVTGAGTYKVGQNVTIDATLATSPTGYTIRWSNWTSNNTSLISNNSTKNATITMPAGNVTLTANATNAINKYTVTCIDKVGNASGATLGTSTWTENYGTTVSGSSATKTYSGYTYSSCTSATVTTSGATVYRYFTQTSAGTLYNRSWSFYNDTTNVGTIPIEGLSVGDKITFTLNISGNGHLNVWDSLMSATPIGGYSSSGTYTCVVPNGNSVTFEVFVSTPPDGSTGGSIQGTINSITNSAGVPYTLVTN